MSEETEKMYVISDKMMRAAVSSAHVQGADNALKNLQTAMEATLSDIVPKELVLQLVGMYREFSHKIGEETAAEFVEMDDVVAKMGAVVRKGEN